MATVEVMLDIYSGLPNPTWKLSHSQIEEMRRLVEESRGDRREAEREPPGLGYRGFTITNRSEEPGVPYRVQVYGGVLTITETFEKERPHLIYCADSRGLESWLIRQATEQGYPEDITK